MQLLTRLAPRITWQPFKHAVRGASRCGTPAVGRTIGTVAGHPKEGEQEQYYFQLGQEDTIFDFRFLKIWEGLMMFPNKTQKWDMILSNSPPGLWLSRIKEHTPKPFKSILASQEPPTIAQLESLEWSDTVAAGVYGLAWKPKAKSVYLDSECHLYTGSASNYGRGLADGTRNCLSIWPSTRNDPPKPEMRCLGLSPGKLVTYFEVPFRDESDEEIERIKTLVALARTVFVIWLGAVRESSKHPIKDLVPWGLNKISYHGLASHNPLIYNIKNNGRGAQRSQRRQGRQLLICTDAEVDKGLLQTKPQDAL